MLDLQKYMKNCRFYCVAKSPRSVCTEIT